MDLSGSGSLAPAAVVGFSGSIALAGGGSLVPAAIVGLPAALALAGEGLLGPTPAPRPTGQLSLSGSGTLTAMHVFGLSGSGTLSVQRFVIVTLSLYGNGTLARAAVVGVARTVALSGSGSLTGYLRTLSGEGALVATGVPRPIAGVALSGDGVLAVTPPVIVANIDFKATATLAIAGQLVIYPLTRLVLLNDTVAQAPGVLELSFFEGWPATDVIFSIDGFAVTTLTTDSDGNIFTNSISVPSWVGTGTHTVTAEQAGAASASATFTVLHGGSPLPSSTPADDAPAFVPNSANRWVFQDLRTGGLGSYVLERNPDRWQPPHVERQHEVEHTTAQEGQFHVWGGGQQPVEWSFAGIVTSQAMAEQLEAYFALNRRFYVIDHRGRAWVTTFMELDLSPRTRRIVSGQPTDWVQDYTVKALAFDQKWVTLP